MSEELIIRDDFNLVRRQLREMQSMSAEQVALMVREMERRFEEEWARVRGGLVGEGVGGVCPKVEPGGASSCPPSRAPGP